MAKRKHRKTKYEKMLEQNHKLKVERREYWMNYIHTLYEKFDKLSEKEQDALFLRAYNEICPKEFNGKPISDIAKRAYRSFISDVKEEMIEHKMLKRSNKQYEEGVEKVKMLVLSYLDNSNEQNNVSGTEGLSE